MDNKDPRTYAIIGAAMEVHNKLGFGFLEAVYQEALAIEMDIRAIPYQQQVDIPVLYKDVRLATNYRADLVCYEDVIVEIKAIKGISEIEQAQLLNYLKATQYHVGLLINFGAPSLQYKRYIATDQSWRASILHDAPE